MYLSSGSDDDTKEKNIIRLSLAQNKKLIDVLTSPDHAALQKYQKWNNGKDVESKQMATRILARIAINAKVDVKGSAFRAIHFK